MQAYSCLRKNNVLTMITSMAGRREVSRSCTWRCYSAHLLFVNHRSVRLMAQGKTRVFKLKHRLLDILEKLPQTRRRAKNTFHQKSRLLSKMPRCTESVYDYLLIYMKLIYDIVLECENWQFHWATNGLRRLSGQTDNHEKHCRGVSFIAK